MGGEIPRPPAVVAEREGVCPRCRPAARWGARGGSAPVLAFSAAFSPQERSAVSMAPGQVR